MSKYADPEYWEERYRSNDTTFDWYVTFDTLEPILRPLLQPAEQIRVLVVGCGNSRLSASLYEQLGIRKITNVDVSPTVIAQMQRRYKGMDEMLWVACDLLQTPPEKLLPLLCPNDYLYDFIIEKGLVDATLGGHNSFHNLYTLTKNLSRLLKKGGRFLSISYGSPETRLDHFRRRKLFFDVEHRTVEKPMFSSTAKPTGHYHIYIMTKLGDKQSAAAAAAVDDVDGTIGSGDSDEEDDFYDRFMTQTASAAVASGMEHPPVQ
ncbi:putative methyltransferase [Trypanosoma theileri]|uniref:Putative methyltransferase n=1 Tax=Trypanosoma theileri TaxID=67003 RepID=A0A1X0NKH4_9TRYP|nr:putative methyltransferase [Trypanosoma theileri]ORC85091.1 putative methyltransferase [Trypanosoma theileri]